MTVFSKCLGGGGKGKQTLPGAVRGVCAKLELIAQYKIDRRA